MDIFNFEDIFNLIHCEYCISVLSIRKTDFIKSVNLSLSAIAPKYCPKNDGIKCHMFGENYDQLYV